MFQKSEVDELTKNTALITTFTAASNNNPRNFDERKLLGNLNITLSRDLCQEFLLFCQSASLDNALFFGHSKKSNSLGLFRSSLLGELVTNCHSLERLIEPLIDTDGVAAILVSLDGWDSESQNAIRKPAREKRSDNFERTMRCIDKIEAYKLEDGRLHIVLGKDTATVPAGTIVIGNCAAKHGKQGPFARGCPPVASAIYRAVTGRDPDGPAL